MPKSLAEHLSEVRRAIPVGDRDAQANSTAPINDHVDLSQYRPITPQEKALLTAMLHSSGPEALAFLPQLEDMMVKHSECTCGCPSLEFAPPPDETRTAYRYSNIVADMYGYANDVPPETNHGMMGLILWQAGGKLTGLEAYDLAGRPEGKPYPLPDLETIHTAEQTSTHGPGAPGSRS
ncbi:hypothetical protein [Terriglobus roseus]|uniref:Uncharacterized protein n=1 Tax=Terriglobus roseus TaxID=392734 RepID=A0A1G7MZS3_9BACT|nr:hypothetical protein [Terriglobus roseus]SDF67212.1 hypothetical protein SAMN05444167_2958 [Terriglobus roseus]